MNAAWKAVWSRREPARGAPLDLDTLIKLDGFDTGASRVEVSDWRTYVRRTSVKLGIRQGSTVYEVGCGAGAFLFAMREQYPLSVGGIDYSPALISDARRAMPDGEFKVGEAITLESDPKYDYVVANSVFHYFDQTYAEDVLAQMILKARVAVAVLEVPDQRTISEAEALRSALISPDAYAEKYAGLRHTYYERTWFKLQAEAQAMTCEIFDRCIPNYAQNRYRFGAILRKRQASVQPKCSAHG